MIVTSSYKNTRWYVWIIAAVMVLLSGVLYRLSAHQFGAERLAEDSVGINLSALPVQAGQWSLDADCNEARIGENIVNGVYRNSVSGASANVFLVCTASPRDMVGHKPQVCYAGDGWVHEGSETYEIASEPGKVIPCNIHQFYKSVGDYERLVVLVLYVVNGKAVSDEDAFSGLSWRRAKVPGEPEWYVAQVQISSNCESSVVLAAQALADVLIGMLPDEKGVEQSSQNQADVLSKL